MKRRQLLQAGAALAALPPVVRAQSAPTAVTLQIDGAAVPFYAPIYVAIEKGYFAKRGINVKLLYASAAEIAKNVAAGNVDFGFPNADAVLAARASNVPIKVIHSSYQRSIGATLFKHSSGIRTFADLKGKRVAVTTIGSPNYLQLQVGLKEAGLSMNDIQLEVISTGAIVQALQADKVDAVVFSELRRYNLEADGVKVGVILSNDFLPSYGNVVAASDRLVQQKGALAKAFTQALSESFQWTIDGHAERQSHWLSTSTLRLGRGRKLFCCVPCARPSFPRSGKVPTLRRTVWGRGIWSHGKGALTCWHSTR